MYRAIQLSKIGDHLFTEMLSKFNCDFWFSFIKEPFDDLLNFKNFTILLQYSNISIIKKTYIFCNYIYKNNLTSYFYQLN